MSSKNNVVRLVRPKSSSRRQRKDAARGPAMEALTKFRWVINSTRRHFKWIEQQTGISGALVAALWEIHRSPGLRVSELAEAMAVHQSTASNLMDKLQQKGLIERDRSSDDQRVVKLYLTKHGEALVKRAPNPARGLLQEALHKLPPATLQTLNRGLAQLIQELHQADPQSFRRSLGDKLSS
jgi:DNA-binding MarR family transcriptional regulator